MRGPALVLGGKKRGLISSPSSRARGSGEANTLGSTRALTSEFLATKDSFAGLAFQQESAESLDSESFANKGTSQNCPVQLMVQLHVATNMVGMQSPPFRQGLALQGLFPSPAAGAKLMKSVLLPAAQ